jgi:GABA(A) receptor-associated protein
MILNTIKKSREEVDRIRVKYPDRIPIFVTKSYYSTSNVPDIDKNKYLAPIDLTLGQFQFVIRKRLKITPDKALFFFIDGMILCTSELLVDIYEKLHDKDDGFLYIMYSGESTFGSF